eukprot:CAMPEP_0178437872 /NCGR_PEP_ID=MMETSP0689_2-20121128/35249_1 /TAXON_ID=160604 /ORGANISM="Amphidinium massartii, Strain CS-259" /LENGTH=39 /DNA_ID= /DNA_START= /DNA_END= /DNA_ORIENTATION=
MAKLWPTVQVEDPLGTGSVCAPDPDSSSTEALFALLSLL